MKKLLVGLCAMLVCVASATTINLDWIVDGNTYAQTTCESGNDLIIPTTTPTKRGYHFVGWDLLYTRLDYIESTGSQYIDTGYKPTPATTKISGKFSFISNAVTTAPFGARKLSSQGIANIFLTGASQSQNANKLRLDWATGTNTDDNTQFSQTLTANIPFTVTITGNSAIVDDLAHTFHNTISATLIPHNLYIFSSNNDGSPYIPFHGKLYYFKIYENDTLVANLIPVRRNSDNEVGMYDTVTGTFFTNAGTGNFIAGPVSANQTLE